MEDIFKIKMPNYIIKFDKNKNYKFSSIAVGKVNLQEVLLKYSSGYCMYCYSRIYVDNKNYAHLEHTIEQDTIQELKDCHYNISIACPTCNLSYKKRQQAERKIIGSPIFCDRENCKENPCEEFYKIANQYLKNMEDKELDKIILKPRGVLHYPQENGIFYDIEYDILNQKFIPADKIEYSSDAKYFIESHIKKFHLNDEENRTREILKVIEDIFKYDKLPNKKRYDNLIAELFIEKLEKIMLRSKNSESEFKKVKKICEHISLQLLMKSK